MKFLSRNEKYAHLKSDSPFLYGGESVREKV